MIYLMLPLACCLFLPNVYRIDHLQNQPAVAYYYCFFKHFLFWGILVVLFWGWFCFFFCISYCAPVLGSFSVPNAPPFCSSACCYSWHTNQCYLVCNQPVLPTSLCFLVSFHFRLCSDASYCSVLTVSNSEFFATCCTPVFSPVLVISALGSWASSYIEIFFTSY